MQSRPATTPSLIRFDPFRPAIALMRRMRIRVKFLLIAVLFVVPLVISAAVFEHRVGADIARTERQLSGLRYCRDLLPVSEFLQDRRSASDAALRGDGDAPAQLQEIDRNLRSAMQTMQATDDRNGAALGLGSRWRETNGLWESAHSLPPDGTPQRNYEAHTALLQSAQSLLQAALASSQLMLDQDVGVHYAVQSGFQQAQSLIESLAAMRTLAISALRHKALSDEERALLRAQTERVRIFHAELSGTLESLLVSAPQLRTSLSESLEGAAQALRFTSVVEKAVLNAAAITMPPAPVASLGMKATKSAQQISAAVVDHIDRELNRRLGELAHTRLLLIAASSFLVLSACYLLVAFIRAVRMDLRQVEERLDDIASGVLTGQSVITGRDEFAELLRRVDTAQERLLSLIRDVQSDAGRLDSAAQQISHENSELSERTGRMVDGLESASSSVLELARSVNEGNVRVAALDTMARQSSEVATEAGRMVDQVVSRIQAISQSSRKIEVIISAVDAITFQTRLLSLNAAVEAARAGEHGRGFGVVATEVRQLAARSQQASGEIRTLVQASLAEVSEGTRLASYAHAQMLRVVEAAQKLSDVIAEATLAAREQGEAAVRIGPLIQQVKSDSEHNAERVGQVAQATGALDEMARSLHESMARFQIESQAA